MQDLQQRYEMAMEDVRELKAENERLAKDVARASSQAASTAAPAIGDGFDWETQKQRMLAQLEDDGDDGGPEQAKERMTIEGTIRITDQVVAEREREIAELRELLEQQAESIGNVAVGASAIAEIFDQDELILEERANLKRMKEELQEKLKQAEIEHSMERARLGRERNQLEEKLRTLEEKQSKRQSESPQPSGAAKPQKSGNWLARLGLKDELAAPILTRRKRQTTKNNLPASCSCSCSCSKTRCKDSLGPSHSDLCDLNGVFRYQHERHFSLRHRSPARAPLREHESQVLTTLNLCRCLLQSRCFLTRMHANVAGVAQFHGMLAQGPFRTWDEKATFRYSLRTVEVGRKTWFQAVFPRISLPNDPGASKRSGAIFSWRSHLVPWAPENVAWKLH